MKGVKVALGYGGMPVEAERHYTQDRKEWRAL